MTLSARYSDAATVEARAPTLVQAARGTARLAPDGGQPVLGAGSHPARGGRSGE